MVRREILVFQIKEIGILDFFIGIIGRQKRILTDFNHRRKKL